MSFGGGQPLMQVLFGGAGGAGGGFNPFPASDAQAGPGQMATAQGSRSSNPWNFQNLMSNPMMKLGLGLLQQGGHQSRPHSVGQDISRAVGGMQEDEEAASARQMREMQLQMMKQQQEAALRQLQFLDPNTGGYNGGMGPSTPPRTGY